ncbi:MAG: VOC family protein [Acidimicrobiia bacterium]|nr:VOC family protein [Acidimicrobiia bacterium]
MSFDLDHVAIGLPDVTDTLFALVGDLGGTPIRGGEVVGFRAMQVRLGNAERGMTVELLEPFNVHLNDFLSRFLERHEHGPHHLTFKVDDIVTELDRLRGLGYQPINVNLENAIWREAFLHPKDGHGTVVQIAQPGVNPPMAELIADSLAGRPHAMKKWWPEPPFHSAKTVFLERVVLNTPTPTETQAFFIEVLGGAPDPECADECQVVWPGGARLALEHHAGKEPGIDRFELTGGEPGERMIGGTTFRFLG